MRYLNLRRVFILTAYLITVLTGATQVYADEGFRHSVGRAREYVDKLELESARSILTDTLAQTKDPDERAQAFDLLGITEGLSARYGHAFEAFFRSARVGSEFAVSGIEHPQTPTRRMAECAIQLERAELSFLESEALLRQNLGKNGGKVPLGELLAAELFAEQFVCPEVPMTRLAEASPPPKPNQKQLATTPSRPASADFMPKEVYAPRYNQPQEHLRGPPVMTWVLGALALAAAGTGATLGAVNLQADGTSVGTVSNTQSPNDTQSSGFVVDRPEATNVAFAVAGGAALGAILFWVLDMGDNDVSEDTDTLLTPTGVRVNW